MRFPILIFLLSAYSCSTGKGDIAIFGPVLVSEDLTEEKLKENGFKKAISGSKTFYVYKHDYREIKYEIDEGDIVGRTFRIRYDDQKKFLSRYDGEIIATHDKNDFIKFRIRDLEVSGKVVREADGVHIEIFTDLFHTTMH